MSLYERNIVIACSVIALITIFMFSIILNTDLFVIKD